MTVSSPSWSGERCHGAPLTLAITLPLALPLVHLADSALHEYSPYKGILSLSVT